MVLTYSKEQFKYKIQAGIKIHTIREDKNERRKPGMKIHMWLHNPRNVSKHPHQFLTNQCLSIQRIRIMPTSRSINILRSEYIHILNSIEIKELAINDGFESDHEFWQWFKKDFYGKIIHWTEKIY